MVNFGIDISKYNAVVVLRCKFDKDKTFGVMFVNDKFQCYTLEPYTYPEILTLRDFKAQKSVEQVYNKRYLSVPAGVYDLRLDTVSPLYYNKLWSKSFCGGKMPWIVSSTHDRALIHPGNYAKDTKGCLLVGSTFNNSGVFSSVDCFKNLYTKLSSFKQPIKIQFIDVR